MTTIEGQYFDGHRPVPTEAKIDFVGPDAKLTIKTNTTHFSATQLLVSPRIASASRFINFPDGTQFLCADQAVLDRLPQESASEGIVAWLENRWQVALASVVMIVITLFAGYHFGLPILAERLAEHVPIKTERALGEHILTFFDEEEWFEPSNLEVEIQDEIYEGFIGLCNQLQFQDYYLLEFRSGGLFGPNAFALPGGIIVLTDELVDASETVEEILAVLAHEIGHVELRHTMRSILQNSIVAAAAAAITSDAASLSVAVSSLPVLVAQRKYSREFESAADDYAFELLLHHGYSPASFASIMERLSGRRGARSSSFSYFSTHPATDQRVENAREAAADGTTEP